MAISSALSTLRGASQRQADDIYNPYIVDAARIRTNQNISNGYRLQQLEQRVTRAQNDLQSLLDRVNKAETSIRQKAAALSSSGPASEVNEIARSNILLAWENNKHDLHKVCTILVSQNDRTGFAVLRSMIPYLLGAAVDSADIATHYEVQLYTRDEKATLGELWEVDGGSMTYLRNNFTTLEGFFAGQLLPTAVGGMFQRLHSLYGWFGLAPTMRNKLGLPWDDLSQQTRILLVDDLGHTVNDPVTYTAPASY